jgi:hypothetical protein
MKNIQNLEPNLVLKSIEKLSTAFKDSELTDQNKTKILHSLREEAQIVKDFLHCNDDEAWLFSVMFAMSISGKDTDLDSLTQYLSCNPFFIVSLSPVLESLVSKRLLIKNTGYDMKVIATRFHVSNYVFNAISLNKSIPKNDHVEDVYEVIERVNEMICEREKNNIPTDELFTEAVDLLKREAKRFKLVQSILDFKLYEDDTLLLVHLCHSFANDSNEADIERYIYYVYDSMGSKIRAKKNLFSGQSQLIEQDLACFVDDSFYGGKELALTDKAIDLLFSEDLGALEKSKPFNPKHCIFIAPEKIKPVELFFNQEEKKQLDLFFELLEKNNFKKTISKFEKMGYASGLTFLLYGDPGTGKTQIAYNLAHITNRPLLLVDISSIRDKYVGESEKRIKQVFKTYKQAKDYYDQCPILFFNESDALISKRYEVSSSVDQMNNSMQNILLQELEDFEGILIATSNMNMNLDNAFERRFLYKVKFNKPDTKTRELIWQAKIADLSDKDAQRLAKDFVLTGGQIANVVRKYTLENILKDAAPNIEELRELCTTEFFGKNDRLIGFKKE